jgi:hypothetical protein
MNNAEKFLYSDTHKDAYGFRPSVSDINEFNSFSEDVALAYILLMRRMKSVLLSRNSRMFSPMSWTP